MNHLVLASTAFALFVIPGPTNALLALPLGDRSASRAIARIVLVTLGYLLVIAVVAGAIGPYLVGHPATSRLLKLAAAGWVLYLAMKLWAPAAAGHDLTGGNARLLITTLLNPKGVVVGLGLRTSASFPSAEAFTILAASIASASVVWLVAGRLLAGRVDSRTVLARRASSAALFVFSAMLATNALS